MITKPINIVQIGDKYSFASNEKVLFLINKIPKQILDKTNDNNTISLLLYSPSANILGENIYIIAANNANDIFYNYLQTGKYEPKASKQTIANAMDVGDPSNFARIYDLYGESHAEISKEISG